MEKESVKLYNHQKNASPFVLVALVIALGGGASVGVSAQQLDPVKLAIGYIPNVQFTPLYVGIDKGFYREAGIDLTIEYGFGIDIFSLLSLGKIDVGLSDSDQLILAGSKNLGLVAIYQYYQSYPIAIVAKSGEIKSPADFVGKKIGTPELFGSSYIGLMLFLDHYHLRDKVSVEKIGYTQIPALMSGQVSGAVCFVTNETVKLHEMNVPLDEWDVRDFSNMVGSSFITSQALIDRKGDVLQRFLAATKKATAYTVDHPDEAFSIAVRFLDKPDPSQTPFLQAALASTIELFKSPKGYGYLDVATYADSIQTLAKLGLIPAAYPAEKLIHSF